MDLSKVHVYTHLLQRAVLWAHSKGDDTLCLHPAGLEVCEELFRAVVGQVDGDGEFGLGAQPLGGPRGRRGEVDLVDA